MPYEYETRNTILDSILKLSDETDPSREFKVRELEAFISEEESILDRALDIPQKRSHALDCAMFELRRLSPENQLVRPEPELHGTPPRLPSFFDIPKNNPLDAPNASRKLMFDY